MKKLALIIIVSLAFGTAYAADKPAEPTKEQLITQITALDKDYQLKQAQIKVLNYEMRDIAEAYKAAKGKLDAIVKAEKDAKDAKEKKK